jgi:hypothetical protein
VDLMIVVSIIAWTFRYMRKPKGTRMQFFLIFIHFKPYFLRVIILYEDSLRKLIQSKKFMKNLKFFYILCGNETFFCCWILAITVLTEYTYIVWNLYSPRNRKKKTQTLSFLPVSIAHTNECCICQQYTCTYIVYAPSAVKLIPCMK